MSKWKSCKNEIRKYCIKIMVVVQLLLLAVEVISIIILTPFILYPNSIYKIHLHEIKNTLFETYRSFDYDFISTSVRQIISNKVDRLGSIIERNGIDYYIISLSLVLLANFTITILTFLSCGRLPLMLLISGILCLGISINFSYRFIFNDYELKKISYQLINNTFVFRKSFHFCVICYRSEEISFNKDVQNMNVLALALHAFKCCGIESHEDVMHEDEIPYTCCPRPSYKYSNVQNSTQCDNNTLYPPCIDKILPFIQSAFRNVKISIVVVGSFNGLYAVLSLIVACDYKNNFKERQQIYGKHSKDNSIVTWEPYTAKKHVSNFSYGFNYDSSSDSTTITKSISTQRTRKYGSSITDTNLTTRTFMTPSVTQVK